MFDRLLRHVLECRPLTRYMQPRVYKKNMDPYSRH